MKEHSKKDKDNDVDASDDTLGENTEQTSLAKEIEKDQNANEEESDKND